MNATTVQTQERKVEYVAGFDDGRFGAQNGRAEPAWLKELREEAFAAYQAAPMPTSRVEEWRRTDPALFPFAKAQALPRLPRVDAGAASAWDEHFDAVVSITDAGVAITDVSGAMKAGQIVVLPLAEAAEKHPDIMRARLRESMSRAGRGKFEMLNDAFWNTGVFVMVPPGVELPRGILIRYDLRREGSVIVPRVLVVAGERSKATVLEHLVSAVDALTLTVMSKDLYLEAEARLKVITLQEWGRNTHHIVNDWALVARAAQVDWVTLNFGSRRSKMRFGSDVAGEGAAAELDGLYFATGEQHFDQKTLQVHSAPNTYSRLLYKGAAKDTAHSIYQGLIIARPGAVHVDAYQKNNNLVLNDGARADSLPGLEIDTDDLKCSHGSTIGNLDDEQVFYLRSRGLDPAEARRTLIRGFFQEVAGRIPYEFVQEAVQRHIEEKIES